MSPAPGRSCSKSARAALVIVDVQVDFAEMGALPVIGGAKVARDITAHLRSCRDRYDLVIGSLDWHLPNSDNGGHFAIPPAEPDYVETWPAHCVAGQRGAQPHPGLDTSLVDLWVKKGQGAPSYSAFQGCDDEQHSLEVLLADRSIAELHICGLALDYCVRETALDARSLGFETTLAAGLTAAVHPDQAREAMDAMQRRGVRVAAGAFA
jgi:nicotinamidase/pyrazinamidase